MERHGSIIKLKAEKLEEYKVLHADVWPDVLAMIRACNLRNYSIYYRDGFLFSYFEYHGSDLAGDMKKMAADPRTQAWWKLTDPMQSPLEFRKEGEVVWPFQRAEAGLQRRLAQMVKGVGRKHVVLAQLHRPAHARLHLQGGAE